MPNNLFSSYPPRKQAFAQVGYRLPRLTPQCIQLYDDFAKKAEFFSRH
jgi:hypothetical protein